MRTISSTEILENQVDCIKKHSYEKAIQIMEPFQIEHKASDDTGNEYVTFVEEGALGDYVVTTATGENFVCKQSYFEENYNILDNINTVAKNSTMIVNPLYISNSDLLQAYNYWIDSKEDFQKWKDRFDTSVGQTELELAAGFGAFVAYQGIVGRREIPLSTCQNYSSAIGAAWDHGYSAFRGQNIRIQFTLIPNETITYKEWDEMGIFDTYSILATDDIAFNAGEEVTFTAIIGNLKTASIPINTDAVKIFSFYDPGISEDIKLYLGDTKEVPVSSNGMEMSDDKWIVKTNTYESIDCMYSQLGEYAYSSGDRLRYRTIEINDIYYNNFSISDCHFTIDSQILSHSLIQDHQDKEDIEKLRVTAPLQNDIKHIIRARQDFYKLLIQSHRDIISGNYFDITAGLLAVTYQLQNNGILSETEKESLRNNVIASCKPGGTANAYIYDPEYYKIPITIEIWKEPGKSLPNNFNEIINTILTTKSGLIGSYLDPKEIERLITYYTSVQIARVSFITKTWTPLTYYSLYDIVNTSLYSSDNDWVCSEILAYTGGVNPFIENEYEDGTKIIDGNIIWRKVSNSEVIPGILSWTANTSFKFGNFIRNNTDIWMMDGIIEKTADVCPFPDNENAIMEEEYYDGNIHWIQTTDRTNKSHQVNTPFYINDVIQWNGINYKADKYVYKSGSDTDFSNLINEYVTDGRLKWKFRSYEYQKIKLNWKHAAILEKSMTLHVE